MEHDAQHTQGTFDPSSHTIEQFAKLCRPSDFVLVQTQWRQERNPVLGFQAVRDTRISIGIVAAH